MLGPIYFYKWTKSAITTPDIIMTSSDLDKYSPISPYLSHITQTQVFLSNIETPYAVMDVPIIYDLSIIR